MIFVGAVWSSAAACVRAIRANGAVEAALLPDIDAVLVPGVAWRIASGRARRSGLEGDNVVAWKRAWERRSGATGTQGRGVQKRGELVQGTEMNVGGQPISIMVVVW
jgi:hypothetical protein